MAKATYYVLSSTLWQGDSFKPAAGPFASKAEAEKAAEALAHDGWSSPKWDEMRQAWWAPTQNLANVVKSIVVSKTTMHRVYGWKQQQADEYITCQRPLAKAGSL